MNRRALPPVLMALTAVAVAFPAAALPPASAVWVGPVLAADVDDATLGTIRGRYFGADMLVGVRIQLVSQVATANGNTATASGRLEVVRTATGYDVQVDSQASAKGASGGGPTGGTSTASGGDTLSVNGIGQVTQIAGNGNRLGNIAIIRFGDAAGAPSYNGIAGQSAQDGGMTAYVSFDSDAVRIGVAAPGATVVLVGEKTARVFRRGETPVEADPGPIAHLLA